MRKDFESAQKMIRKYGPARAELIQQRISEFIAAEVLQDLVNLPGPKFHQHVRKKGQARAIFSVNLDQPYRLLFRAAADPEPQLPSGGADLTQITAIEIIEIVDPHGN